jgi:hypothetical protein
MKREKMEEEEERLEERKGANQKANSGYCGEMRLQLPS